MEPHDSEREMRESLPEVRATAYTSDEVLGMMQGTEGLGQGLTTYPASTDEDLLALHAECLALETAGQVVRSMERDGATHPSGLTHVMWLPVPVPPAP